MSWILYKFLNFLRTRFLNFSLFLKRRYWISRINSRGSVGDGFYVQSNARLQASSTSEIHIGKGVGIATGVNIELGPKAKLFLEDNVYLSRFTQLIINGELRIGSGSQIAHCCDFNCVESEQIILASEVWLGSAVSLKSNCNIGKHCVIAAGAKFSGQMPDASMVRGIQGKPTAIGHAK